MKSQYWCNDCGYLYVVDSGFDGGKCPGCGSKRVMYEMSVVNDRIYVSKKAHEVNKYD